MSSSLERFEADGARDPGFGVDGRVDTFFSTAGNRIHRLTPLLDGRLLASVSITSGAGVLARYDSAGRLDTSFGGGDALITLAGTYALRPDGRILVAGRHSAMDPTPGLTEFSADGVSLNSGFGGGDGFVPDAIASRNPLALALQEDGRILLATCDAGNKLALHRYEPDGTPDPGFGGGDGHVVVQLVPDDVGCHRLPDIQLLGNGRILVGVLRTDWKRMLVDADGTPVEELGALLGYLEARFTLTAGQSGGRTLVAWADGFEHVYLARLLADGTQDLGFGSQSPLHEGQYFSRTIPAGVYSDPEGGALTWTATLVDGSALPGWLLFDPATLSFSGTPPAGAPDLIMEISVAEAEGLSLSDTIGWRVLPAPDP
jgi:uncharacterized delta-60 repeat protein